MIMRMKWFGTATILLEQDGACLLFDPFISRNDKLFTLPIGDLPPLTAILVTHGHLDHIADIPQILEHEGNAPVYCTARPHRALAEMGVPPERLRTVAPADVLHLDPFTITVLKGRHVVFDKKKIMKSLLSPRLIRHWNPFMTMMKENRICEEAGETVVFDIQAQEKRILLLGSLNLKDDAAYPIGADLLILPYTGRSSLPQYAMTLIDRLRPRRIVLDHYDDSFPPISSPEDPEIFRLLMARKYPGVPVLSPQAGPGWIEWEN